MGQNNLEIAALISSRICHDLISPIGAINNGLELLGMAGGAPGPELDLISESVGNASARIRFFRVAYGAAGEQEIGRAEVVSILDDITRGSRLRIAYGPLDPQPRAMLRLVFLAIQCLESAMAYGGRIEVNCDWDRWTLVGNADKLNIDTALWNRMQNAGATVDTDIAPAQVQFALLSALAREGGCNLVADISDTDIIIRF